MAELNERQQKFCEVYVANGGDATAAARTAGYADTPNTRVTAHKVLKLPQVQAEIEVQLRKQMAMHGPVALKRIKELMDSDVPSVALKAAMDFADRAGLKPREQIDLKVFDERTDDEISASIVAAIAELGIEPDSVH